jgi:hypothetical protein
VHSYTSNSKIHIYCRSWILAVFISTILLGGLEVLWRSNGNLPAIVDDQSLWAIERSKVGKSEKEIVLLGSSRMQTDISIPTLRKLALDHNIINLSADGTCANCVLYDLSKDKTFRGTVIVEITSECLMFGEESGLSQQFYVDYYHDTYNFNIELNRRIATFIQKHLTIVDPYLNLIKVLGELILKRKWRSPNYLTTYEDRSRSADYTKLDILQHKKLRLHKVAVHYKELAPRISIKTLLKHLPSVEEAVKAIQLRGGNVVFVRFPVSDEHWILDEQYFPRAIYWDPMILKTTAFGIHFKDIEGMKSLQCPDTSHLDVKDKKIFTSILFNQLKDL